MRTIVIVLITTLACANAFPKSGRHYDVRGKIALVTGGNRGIGLSITTELLRNGVKGVSMIGVNPDKGKEAVDSLSKTFGPGKVISLIADVSNEKQFEDAFNASVAHWGGLDIVINNAGVVNENNPVVLTNINAVGVMHGTFLGLKYMSVAKGGRGGVVINLSSIYGIDHLFVSPVYSATKAFVLGLSRALGHQVYYDHNKVRIITLCPGLTKTDLLNKEPFMNAVNDAFKPGLKEMAYEVIEKSFLQSPDNLGKAAIILLKHGPNGSVWVAEDGQPPFEVEFPDRKSMKKQSVSHFVFE